MSALYLEVALKGELLLFLLVLRLIAWRDDRRFEDRSMLERIDGWLPYVHIFSFKEGSLLPLASERRQRRVLRRCVRKGWVRHEEMPPYRADGEDRPPAWHYLWLTPAGREELVMLRGETLPRLPPARLLPRPS